MRQSRALDRRADGGWVGPAGYLALPKPLAAAATSVRGGPGSRPSCWRPLSSQPPPWRCRFEQRFDTYIHQCNDH